MKAVVFAGQGCQRKGMGLDAVAASPAARKLWHTTETRLRGRTGINITEVVRDNPPYLSMFDNALKPHTTRITDPDANLPESHPKPHRINHQQHGVLGATFLTQPAVLTAQLALYEWMKEKHPDLVGGANVFAGHSLGEFTALAAMGVLPADVAAELTFRRGAWMEAAITLGTVVRPNWQMFAVNPTRAKLDTQLPDGTAIPAEDVLAYLVELISDKLQHTTSWVEIVNYNVGCEQCVVAGDEIGLSILGKCIDPIFRVNVVNVEKVTDFPALVSAAAKDTRKDLADGYNEKPNAPAPKDFVPASWQKYGRREVFMRRMISQDDGQTLPLERLTHLTLERDGRSGLKKKSWFMPLPVDVPFHSSHLRRAMDNFHQDCLDALPSSDLIEKALEGKQWVCNLTGTVFDSKSPQYLEAFVEAVQSQNIGERVHAGKYSSTTTTKTFLQAAGVPESSITAINNGLVVMVSPNHPEAMTPSGPADTRTLMAATMAAQLAHPVQWIDSMATIVDTLKCRTIVEVSPTRTLTSMFKKATEGMVNNNGGGCVSGSSSVLADHINGDTASGLRIISLPTECGSL